MRISESELILNPDGSVYHLHLKPEDIAHTIITVGDPDRVARVSSHFDAIRHKTNKREFITHTGTLNGVDLTVISTGIGTDNIDIVLTELDALVNIDFTTRQIKKEHTALKIIRLGTCGGLQNDIPLDSLVVSEYGLGFDNFVYFYDHQHRFNNDFSKAFEVYSDWLSELSRPYSVKGDAQLCEQFSKIGFLKGCTVTNVGFYGPQGRSLRIGLSNPDLNNAMRSFEYNDTKILNLEMETAGIYAMATLLGHKALSLNVILANRMLGTFSNNPGAAVDNLISVALNELTK
ncbi:MAG: nucleoside phosphorylase [Gilvibacter sp.]